MAAVLSEDLRQRVVAAIEAGASQQQAAKRFGVSLSSAKLWLRQWPARPRAGGCAKARVPESRSRQTHLSLSRLCAETPSTASRSGGRCHVPFPADGRGIGGTGPIRRASGQARDFSRARNAVRAPAPNASPGCRPPATGTAAALGSGSLATRPVLPTGGARQFPPGIRRNRRPELTFGNEAAFCCGFGKAMS